MCLYHFNRLLETFPTRGCMICIEQFWNEKHRQTCRLCRPKFSRNGSQWSSACIHSRFGLQVLAGVWQSQVCLLWGIGMKFWRLWQYHTSRIWDLMLSSRMTMLAPTEPGSSLSTSRMREWRGWNGLLWVQTSTQLNTCGISLVELYMLEWPTEPPWLTCHKSLLRNGMPSHSRMWPSWWPAWGEGAKLLWLHMDLPHAIEVPDTDCKMNGVYGQCVFFPWP